MTECVATVFMSPVYVHVCSKEPIYGATAETCQEVVIERDLVMRVEALGGLCLKVACSAAAALSTACAAAGARSVRRAEAAQRSPHQSAPDKVMDAIELSRGWRLLLLRDTGGYVPRCLRILKAAAVWRRHGQ